MRKILSLLLVLLMALSFVPLRNTKTVEAASNTPAAMIANALIPVYPNISTADPYDYWAWGEPVYLDVDVSGTVSAGDVLLYGKSVTTGSTISADPLLYWYDNNSSGLFEAEADSLYYDVGSISGSADPGDILVMGPGVAFGTAFTGLASNVNIGFVDIDGNGVWGGKALRPFGFKFGDSSYPFPVGETPIFATDMYLKILQSKLEDHYYVLITINQQRVYNLYIDPDTMFNVPPRGASGADPRSINNTMGPFPLINTYNSVISLWEGPAAGRIFQFGFADMTKSTANHTVVVASGNGYDFGDLFLFFEVLQASCCGKTITYDIGVESDVEPVCWPNPLTNNPKAVARLGKGTGSDFNIAPKEIARSSDWPIPATIFKDITLTNREYLDLEIFRDDGYDNENLDGVTGFNLQPDDLDENYIFDDLNVVYTKEEFVGALDYYGGTNTTYQVIKGTDPVSGKTIYALDLGNDGNINVSDYLLTPITKYYFAVTGVADANYNNLTSLTIIITAANSYYLDINGSTQLDVGDTIVPGDTWLIDNPLSGNITMMYGDLQGMDILVLPGTFKIDVKFTYDDGTDVAPDADGVIRFKVEQTYRVTVSLPTDCNLPDNVRVLVTMELPGYDINGNALYELVYADVLTKSNPYVTHDLTPWRGSLLKDGTYWRPTVRISAFANICDALGPIDARYGYYFLGDPYYLWTYRKTIPDLIDGVGTNGTSYYGPVLGNNNLGLEFGNKYDCFVLKYYDIKPEDLTVYPNKDCISHLDQRWPNIGFTLYNKDNLNDLDDPKGYILDDGNQGLFAYVNANGVGVQFLAVVKDIPTGKYYILQANDGNTLTLWAWNDANGDFIFERGEVTTQPFDIIGRWNKAVDDLDGSGMPSPGDTFSDEEAPYDLEVVDYPLPSMIEGDGTVWALVKPPKSGCGNIKFTLFTTNVLYNLIGPRPPTYLFDPDFGTYYGWDYIDYMGEKEVAVTKLYDINFAEFEIIDEGLRNSEYDNPYPPYGPTVTGANAQYPWVLRNNWWELRSYPGGQEALPGYGWGYNQFGQPDIGNQNARNVIQLTHPFADEFNARHAQVQILFWKLGTAYYPLTNYTIRFIVKDKNGTHLSFGDNDPESLDILSSIKIIGHKSSPDAQPVFVWRPVINGYSYFDGPYDENHKFIDSKLGGGYHLPTFAAIPGRTYSTDYFTYYTGDVNGKNGGEITITTGLFEHDGYTYEEYVYDPVSDRYVQASFSWTLNDVQVIPGIIPTGPGWLEIVVTDVYENSNSYKYCTSCLDNIKGVPVHAIELTGWPQQMLVDQSNPLTVVAKVYPNANAPSTGPADPLWGENTQKGTEPLANNVVVFVWQDIGVEDPVTGLRYGVGDGWITGQPKHTLGNAVVPPPYNFKDFNGDKVISFMDHETEIVGKYDSTTNTWAGGFKYLTSLTYQIDKGEYKFNLSSEEGGLITEVGFDFDGNNVILSDEEIPVRITAYQFGDDGVNPRVYGGIGNGNELWEAYLAGEVVIPVVGTKDWNVESEPCLTAGVLPEAQPDGKPLTFMVTDADGNPVDLSKGIGGKTINEVMIWNGLFDDVVPFPLPETYYWVRTDLHNEAEITESMGGVSISHTLYENQYAANDMYVNAPYDWNGDGIVETDSDGNVLEPIKPDFSEMSDGVYKFNGFVANDKGEFTVRVYSPDRKHYGEVVVKVELPKISYEIVNVDDPNGTVHTVPGDPDFVMTAGDIRLYKVTVTVTDCEDKPIGGPGKPVEECKPAEGGLFAGFLPYMAYTPHYYNWLGYDWDGDSDIWSSEFKPFSIYASTYAFSHEDAFGVVGNYVSRPHLPVRGAIRYSIWWWIDEALTLHGINQSIYNNEYNMDRYEIGQLYPDSNGDRLIDANDLLPLDENGKVTFYIETDDISVLSGLAGKNPYTINLDTSFYDLGNVAGDPYNVLYPRTRFGAFFNGSGMGTLMVNNFFLDWYGNIDRNVNINFMKFNILNGETHQELGKEIFNTNNYDLTYGVENHIVVQALPADDRDIAVRERYVQVQLKGVNVEPWAAGTLMHNDDGVAETTLSFRPLGVGERVAYLATSIIFNHDVRWSRYNVAPWWQDFTSPGEPIYWTYDDRQPDESVTYSNVYQVHTDPNIYIKNFYPRGHDIEDQREYQELRPPLGVSSWPLPYFDAGKGLALTLKGDLVVGVETEVTVKVTEAGPNFPVAGAEVTLYGAGVDLSGVTDADGVAKFMVKPTEAGEILITASKDGYVPGKTVVVVGADTIAPELTVDKPVSPTNKPTVVVTGIATDNAGVPMVMVNGVEATVGADGKFSAEVTLKEGENEIVVVAKDKSGNKTEKVVKVVLDTVPPEVTVTPLAGPVTSTKVKLSGRVEANAKVMVNDKPATVAYDYWEVELTLDYGENLVKIVASDAVGNEKKIETTVVVFKKT
ncbi:MAG: hypothetical protein H5U37_00570, partial [Caldisericia bacterium]|nr:hypothetical protein [Caldisericia bacterium]